MDVSKPSHVFLLLAGMGSVMVAAVPVLLGAAVFCGAYRVCSSRVYRFTVWCDAGLGVGYDVGYGRGYGSPDSVHGKSRNGVGYGVGHTFGFSVGYTAGFAIYLMAAVWMIAYTPLRKAMSMLVVTPRVAGEDRKKI